MILVCSILLWAMDATAANIESPESPDDELWDLLTCHRDDANPAPGTMFFLWLPLSTTANLHL